MHRLFFVFYTPFGGGVKNMPKAAFVKKVVYFLKIDKIFAKKA